MKAVLIVHNAAIEPEINEVLETYGVKCYTKFTNMLGKGQLSQPHWNSDVWPGINYGTFIVLEKNKAEKIMQQIRNMRQNLGSEGLKAFMWQIDDIT